MTTVQPRVTIPVTTGGPQRYGLFNVAIGPLDLPLHAGYGGVQYELEACGDNSVALHSAACASGDPLTTGPGVQLILGDPFVVTAAIACQSVGRPLADFPRIAVERLTAGEQWAVEKAFWDGGPDLAGQIAGVGTLPDVTPTDSTKLSKVVGALEEWLYVRRDHPRAGAHRVGSGRGVRRAGQHRPAEEDGAGQRLVLRRGLLGPGAGEHGGRDVAGGDGRGAAVPVGGAVRAGGAQRAGSHDKRGGSGR
jgi:hypothetical protein